jgi:Rod binding domain-containing protein
VPQAGQLTGQLAPANANQSLQDARTEKLLGQVKASKNSADPKLERAAKAFESILLDKWLEDAQHAFASVPGDDPEKTDQGNVGADQYRSLAMQALSDKITSAGGIGIARMIMHKMESKPAGTKVEPADSTIVSPQGTDGGLPPRNRIKVSPGKDR